MASKDLCELIRTAAEKTDFEPLFDYFAHDIELRISIALQASASEERRGRSSVIRHLRLRYGPGFAPSEEPVDLFGSGDRVVARRAANVAIGSGLKLRDDCALVFDIVDGMIDQLAIHHELSALLDAGRSVTSLARRHDHGRIDRRLAETIER
jgi:ketosteroid isomerase-like protein